MFAALLVLIIIVSH